MAQGFGDELGSLLKQATEMQRRMEAMQRELAERVVEGSAGGGAVKVVVTGHMELQSVTIDPAAVDPDDVPGLEDLVTAAVRQALGGARRLKEQETQRITGGINMPGLGF